MSGRGHAGADSWLPEPFLATATTSSGRGFSRHDGFQHFAYCAPVADCASLGAKHSGYRNPSDHRLAHQHRRPGCVVLYGYFGHAKGPSMRRLSHRYAWPLSGCLLLALVPVVVHSYFRVVVEDCNGFSTFLPQFPSTSKSAGYDAQMRERFQTSERREGNFPPTVCALTSVSSAPTMPNGSTIVLRTLWWNTPLWRLTEFSGRGPIPP